jgi:hypothetical protein
MICINRDNDCSLLKEQKGAGCFGILRFVLRKISGAAGVFFALRLWYHGKKIVIRRTDFERG